MSDADNQMGGSGGETGRTPGGRPTSPASEEVPSDDPRADGDDQVTEKSKGSFPASDPPADY